MSRQIPNIMTSSLFWLKKFTSLAMAYSRLCAARMSVTWNVPSTTTPATKMMPAPNDALAHGPLLPVARSTERIWVAKMRSKAIPKPTQ